MKNFFLNCVVRIEKKCIFAADFASGSSSVGRARPCQGRGREFESRFPLKNEETFHGTSLFCLRKPQSSVPTE